TTVDRGGEPDGQLARARAARGDRVVVVVVAEGEVRAAPRGRFVDRDPRDEVVDAAVHRVDRDSRLQSPRDAVCRGGPDDVVRGPHAAEAAVLPRDVDLAVLADLGRRQRRGAQVAGDVVLAHAGHRHRGLPGPAAVDRAERADTRTALVRDD